MALTVYIDGSFNGKKSVEAMREMLILLRGWILEEGDDSSVLLSPRDSQAPPGFRFHGTGLFLKQQKRR